MKAYAYRDLDTTKVGGPYLKGTTIKVTKASEPVDCCGYLPDVIHKLTELQDRLGPWAYLDITVEYENLTSEVTYYRKLTATEKAMDEAALNSSEAREKAELERLKLKYEAPKI